MELDASKVGVRAVLSQRSSSDEKIHPCAFFFSPFNSHWNGIRNRELLAVKLALEEWHHWLEGAGFPFIVWTDHKNLEYIRTTKNGKPDALSRIFEAKASPTPPVAILQPERVVAAVTWGVESKVRNALSDATVPAGCPESLLFVPKSV